MGGDEGDLEVFSPPDPFRVGLDKQSPLFRGLDTIVFSLFFIFFRGFRVVRGLFIFFRDVRVVRGLVMFVLFVDSFSFFVLFVLFVDSF